MKSGKVGKTVYNFRKITHAQCHLEATQCVCTCCLFFFLILFLFFHYIIETIKYSQFCIKYVIKHYTVLT